MNAKNKEFLQNYKNIKSFVFNNKIIDIWESNLEIIICSNGIELDVYNENDNKLIMYLQDEGFLSI